VFILDSDHLSILQAKRGSEFAALQTRLAVVSDAEVFTTIISFHEQIGGWYKSLARPRKQRDVVFAYQMLQQVVFNFSKMQVLPFNDAAGVQFESLKRQKVRVGTMDLRIASIALANNMILLTRNTVDFERVPGLKFEDWTLPG
jgi:tRNA(fMet)-specific endonuclease VapC